MAAQRIELRSKTAIEDQIAHFGDCASDQSRVELDFQSHVATCAFRQRALESLLTGLIERTGTGYLSGHATLVFVNEATEPFDNFVEGNQPTLIHQIEREIT